MPRLTTRLSSMLVLVLLTGLAALATPTTPLHAAGFVQSLGVASDTASPLTITTTASTRAGDSIIVAVATQTPLTVQCADPVNGTYAIDVANAAQSNVAICAVHAAMPLPAGTDITVSATGGPLIDLHAVALEFSGLARSPLDRTASTGPGLTFSGVM